MNKEQFKSSLLAMLNYYMGAMMGFNNEIRKAVEEQKESIVNMIQIQANATSISFEQELDKLIDKVIHEHDHDECVEDVEPVEEEV
jgi:hypothetical protein